MWNKRPLSVRLAGLVGALAFSTSAPAAELLAVSAQHGPVSASAQSRSAKERRQSTLYRVTRGTEVAYLFGTIHVGAKSFYPLAPEVDRALADASQLVLELDTRANDAFQRAVQKHASYPSGGHIRNHVSADTLVRLTEALHAVGMPLSGVSHLKPWLLANLLMGLELERNGFNRTHGNEFFLLDSIQKSGATVAELESADYQLSLFATLSDTDAEAYLREALADLSTGVSLKKARAVIDAWTSGDAAALDGLISDATTGGTVMSDFTRRTLLGKRNPEMAERIEHMMKDGKVSFVGVGLLHLLGANGLPQLLAQRGYQVERMY